MPRKQILLFAALLTLSASAQLPTLDLTVSDNGRGQLEARFRSDGYFDGLFSATVFTIRWQTSAGIAFGEAVPVMPWQQHMYITGSDDVFSADGYTYRVYSGFGNSALSQTNHHFEAGKEYVMFVMDALVPGTEFELIQDQWTNSHNGDYYISLNGVDQTGVYFESPEPTVNLIMTAPSGNALDVALKANDDYFGWISEVDFTLRWPSTASLSIGSATQPDSVMSYLSIGKFGSEVSSGGFTYQRYHGSGHMSLARAGQALHSGIPQTIFHIPVTGQIGMVALANDTWTEANYGAFEIVLNSAPQTGIIENLSTSLAAVEQHGFSVRVLDNDGQISLQVNTDRPGPMTVKLMNTGGQVLWSTTTQISVGQNKQVIPTGTLPNGMYLLHTDVNGRTIIKKVVR